MSMPMKFVVQYIVDVIEKFKLSNGTKDQIPLNASIDWRNVYSSESQCWNCYFFQGAWLCRLKEDEAYEVKFQSIEQQVSYNWVEEDFLF